MSNVASIVHDQMRLPSGAQMPTATCAFPDCDRAAAWVARGHQPCSRMVTACEVHKAEADAYAAKIIPGWTCVKCKTFSPDTPDEALNWSRL